MVVEMVQNSTFENFIHIQHLFIHIQHFHLFSINICSKFNTYIYIQQFYLFTKLLSIQKLFIHSTTFYSFKNYCASLLRMEVTYFLQQINRGAAKKHEQSINGTLKKILTAFGMSSARKAFADPNI